MEHGQALRLDEVVNFATVPWVAVYVISDFSSPSQEIIREVEPLKVITIRGLKFTFSRGGGCRELYLFFFVALDRFSNAVTVFKRPKKLQRSCVENRIE